MTTGNAKDQDTVRLLILHESQNDAEQYINVLRNAGHATRAQHVADENALVQALQQHKWDLILARPESGELTADSAVSHIKRLDKDIPLILLSNDNASETLTEGLRMGARDVVPAEEHERLRLVVERELQDLGERRQRRLNEINLKETEKRCDLLLDTSRDPITYVTDGMHVYANQAYLELFGYDDSEDLEGLPVMDLIASGDQEAFKNFLKDYSRGEQASNELNCHGVTADGSQVPVRMVFSSATYDGEPCTQILIRSSSDDAELQEKLKTLSSQDLLTGLYNRQYFTEQLDHAVERATGGGEHSAVFYIELDQFDEIKGEVNIAGADLVLSDIANLLGNHIEEGDLLARFGDETFTLLTAKPDPDEALAYADRLRGAVGEHLSEVQDRTVQLSSSIGVALVNESSPGGEDILSRAHQAMEKVRDREGRGNEVRLYTPEDRQLEDSHERQLIARLTRSLDDNSFRLLYQPVISLRGKDQELYEVLTRLEDDNGQEIPPSEFIPVAAKAGLAEKLDRWVILNAAKALAAHRSEGRDTRLMIHVTGNSLRDQTLLPWLSQVLKAARLPGNALVFQFTETEATTYLKQAKDFTKGLEQLHCATSIGHFGCALNPFNALKHLSVEFVKLDGSYLDGINDQENRDALKELVNGIHAQGKVTIMPLVESASILSTLWQIGINYIQGHYLQPPGAAMDYDFSEE